MTLTSFNNYVIYEHYYTSVLGKKLEEAIGLFAPEISTYTWQAMFMHMYNDFLCRWQLEDYEADEDDYTYNFVKPSEAECLSKLSNTIFGTKFCVNFYKDV